MVDLLIKLNCSYENAVQKLSKISLFKLILMTVIFEFFVSILFALFFFTGDFARPEFESKFEEFFLVVFLAPLIETLIFQHVVISYLSKKFPKSIVLSILFSSLLFGLSHFYSQVYIFKTFLSGLLFGTLYLVVSVKNSSPIIAVTTAHSIYNFITFCLQNF